MEKENIENWNLERKNASSKRKTRQRYTRNEQNENQHPWFGRNEMEIQWKNCYAIIYSGNENHFNGVGVIIHPKISKNLSGFGTISDRVLLVKLKNLQHDLSLIQVYAPTSSASDADRTNFFDDVEVTLKNANIMKSQSSWVTSMQKLVIILLEKQSATTD